MNYIGQDEIDRLRQMSIERDKKRFEESTELYHREMANHAAKLKKLKEDRLDIESSLIAR